MWCDDFDMDLPKVIEGARDLLGDVGEVPLWTPGSKTHGALNHPSMWNTDRGLTAFFRTRPLPPPSFYYSPHPLVACTFWEAVRDMWVHQGAMVVDGHLIVDTQAWWPKFEAIMWDLRGLGRPGSPQKAARARTFMDIELRQAASAMRSLLSDGALGRQDDAEPPNGMTTKPFASPTDARQQEGKT